MRGTLSHGEAARERAALAGREWGLRIAGEDVPAAAERSYVTDDPTTGEQSSRVADATQADVDRAVRDAEAAALQWRTTPMEERVEILRELSVRLRDHRDELALIDCIDSGNPLAACQRDIDLALRSLLHQGALALSIRGDAMDGGPERLHYTRHEPYGVVGRIVAYNHPLLYAVARTGPVLLTGNAVLLKPAPQTPLSALRWAQLIDDLLPAGLFNVLTGSGAEVGRSIVAHPTVRRISFIGSVPVGMAIQREAANSQVKNVSLELGGKNPMVVFPDVDVATAARAAFVGMNLTSTQGQSCGSTSRVLVHESIHDEFVEELSACLAEVRLGDPLDQGTTMGPLISAAHRGSVQQWTERAREEGAREHPLQGLGTLPDLGGFFVQPTLLTDVQPDMSIAQQEVFGPVVSVMSFADEAEAVGTANRIPYGLTASVWTADLARAHRVAHDLEAGYVWINDVATHYLGLPFGGFKDSGVGREESVEELLSYTQQKAVHVTLAPQGGLGTAPAS